MKNAFVGMSPRAVPLNDLQETIQRCISTEEGWLFLRWPHQVSGMKPLGENLEKLLTPVKDKKDQSNCITNCTEGQAFDQHRELRWKRKGELFELLLLSASGADDAFNSLGISWETQVFKAALFKNTETRLPRPIDVPENFKLEQRYFIDSNTASVQFIALKAT